MATSDIGKSAFLNVKNKDTGEIEKKTLIPPSPSDGDLGGISEEELAQITKNKEKISSLNAELIDGRTDVDGNVHGKIGDAMRGQARKLRENLVVRQKEQPTDPNNNVWISDEDDEVEVPDMGEFNSLKEEIDDIAVKEYVEMQVEFIEGSYIPYFNQHTITENSNAKYLKISCKSGEKYKIHTKNFYDGRAYALYSGEAEGAIDYYHGTELTEVTEEIAIPKDVTTLVVNSELSFPAKVEKYVINNKNYYAEKKITELEIMRNRHDLEDKTKNLKYWNLIDISKVKEGYGYTNSIGYPPTLVAKDGLNAIDDVIPCKVGETYTVNWLYGAIGIYDSDIKRIKHLYIDSIPKTFIVPDGGCYMTLFGGALRMTDIMLVKGDTLPKKYVPYDIFDIKTKEHTNLFGVKWCAFGDSLTDSATLASQTTGTKNYVDYVSESLGLNVVNCGVGGTGYMKTENRFVNRVSTIPEDTELLTVFGSFNDYEYIESSLGVFGDNGTDTIYGCMKSFFDSVFSRCSDIVIGVILPTKWGYLSPQKDSEASKKCDLYIKALKEIADYYDLPVLNLYNYSNLRPWDDIFAKKYYKDDDGNGVANTVHPLDAAHRRFIAPKVEAFIKQIYHVY